MTPDPNASKPAERKTNGDGATTLIDWSTTNEPVEITVPRIVWSSYAPPPNRHERRKAKAMRRRKL